MMISYTEAQKIVTARAHSFGKETIELEFAYGRVLSEQILADRDYPPFDRSTMDGYAILHADFENGIRHYRIMETIHAGEAGTIRIGSGECTKIMTGAPVPAGADAVIRREEAEERAHAIDVLSENCRPFQNMARKGEDMRAGDTAINANCICGSAVMGLLASIGKKELAVARLPRVALCTTGNEVLQVEDPVSDIQIRNTNRWIIQSLLKKWDVNPDSYIHLPDDRAIMLDELGKLLQGSSRQSPAADLIILSGGVSAGDADHTPGVLEQLGVKQLFHRLAIKPGKPVWCGAAPGGTMVFALPGNPFSCMVTFMLLVDHYLHACFGLASPVPLGFPLGVPRKKRTVLDEFFPCRIAGNPAVLEPVAINGSGDMRLGFQANVLALHPAALDDLPAGTQLSCYPLG